MVPQLVTPIIIEHSKMLAPLEPASAENCTCQLSSYHVRITLLRCINLLKWQLLHIYTLYFFVIKLTAMFNVNLKIFP